MNNKFFLTVKKIPGFLADVFREAFSYLFRKIKESAAKKNNGRKASEVIKDSVLKPFIFLKGISLWSKVIVSFSIVVLVFFIAVHCYFTTHFLQGTVISGVDVSGLSTEDAKKRITDSYEQYELTISEQNSRTETINGLDIGMKVTINDSFNDILKLKSGYSWVKAIFKNENADAGDAISYDYDDSLLDKKISTLNCVNTKTVIEPVNAELYYSNGVFLISESKPGNQVDKAKLKDAVRDAIRNNKTQIDLTAEEIYAMPAIQSDDPVLLAKKLTFDDLSGIKITLKIGENIEEINAEKVSNWYVTDDNGVISFDEALLRQYVDDLAARYDNFSSPKTFFTHYDEAVELSTSYYGWQLDKEYAVEMLLSYIEEKKNISIDLTDKSEESEKWWMKTAVAYDDSAYYGNTYAEVSIDGQYMWMYMDGQVVFESDVVTGKPDSEHDTPVGVYSIIYKELNATLRGADYETEVAYWMVFTFDIGFHDADWQYAFGEDMYEYNGSHGCVNLPVDAAAELYDLVYPGMPVFVY